MSSVETSNTQRRLKLLGSIVLALTLPMLGSCSEHGFELHRLTSEEALIENVPSRGHPIAFVDRDVAMDIELPPGHRGISRNQYIDVYRFAVRYREEAVGPLVLAPPSSRHTGGMGSAAVAEVRRALRDGGVDPERIVSGKPVGGSMVTLAYQKPVAVAPQCGNWPRDVGKERERVTHPDFGCATQHNLAGMVANSRDLMQSQAETPASAERRGRIWSQYATGDANSSKSAASSDAATEAKPKGMKK